MPLQTSHPDNGLWGGLYELPRLTSAENETVEDTGVRVLAELVGARGEVGQRLAHLRHGVTTRKITLHALSASLESLPYPLPDSLIWATKTDLERYPLSSPQAKLLGLIEQSQNQHTLF